jgi:ABC-type Fe3+ transport system permease subunit
LWRSVDALALFLFTLPGTVIGIGLINLWNKPMTNAIYATPAIIILGYLAQ